MAIGKSKGWRSISDRQFRRGSHEFSAKIQAAVRRDRSNSQHVHHVIMPGLGGLPPQRSAQGAPCEQGPVGRDMAQHDPFAISGKDHVMLADYSPPRIEENPMLPRVRAPVIPSRPETRTVSSATPRPSAAARPSIKAVPDGASTFMR